MQNCSRCTVLIPFIALFLLACNAYSPQKKQAPIASLYTQKTPHPDGTGKVYMGREIAHVMSA
ncbi:MAG TPA: hypothetical protein VEY10_12425, partial [Flavisolibacter sp.]|nr:hypothetical protein [Flavisolibacter sp.]